MSQFDHMLFHTRERQLTHEAHLLEKRRWQRYGLYACLLSAALFLGIATGAVVALS